MKEKVKRKHIDKQLPTGIIKGFAKILFALPSAFIKIWEPNKILLYQTVFCYF